MLPSEALGGERKTKSKRKLGRAGGAVVLAAMLTAGVGVADIEPAKAASAPLERIDRARTKGFTAEHVQRHRAATLGLGVYVPENVNRLDGQAETLEAGWACGAVRIGPRHLVSVAHCLGVDSDALTRHEAYDLKRDGVLDVIDFNLWGDASLLAPELWRGAPTGAVAKTRCFMT